MERINLNVPGDARRKIKAMAKRTGETVSEVVRRMVIDGLDRAEREEFYRRVAESQTPQSRARQLVLIDAFERLGV